MSWLPLGETACDLVAVFKGWGNHTHMIRAGTVLASFALAACGPRISTGERLSDIVVAREAGSSTSCVAVGDRTVIYAEDDDGPPGMLRARSFANPQVRAAAERLQTDWDQVSEDSYQTFGAVDGDHCLMVVDYPALSGEFAFVAFSAPSGDMGAYAFRRGGNEWFVVERVVTGYW